MCHQNGLFELSRNSRGKSGERVGRESQKKKSGQNIDRSKYLILWCPRQESNLRTWIRNPMLYPLSYGGEMKRVIARKVSDPGKSGCFWKDD